VGNNVIWLAGLVWSPRRWACSSPSCSTVGCAARPSTRSALYLPVVLSLALVGFIWQLQYAPEQGFLNKLLGTTGQDNLVDWLGNRDINIWSALVAAGWRHVGYITLLYLAGLRSVDPTLREAAAIDGATEWQAFRRVTFPVLRPINVVIVVVTVIEALRAFDIPYVINRGQNGLELLSTVVVNGCSARPRGSAIASAAATVLLLLSIVPIASTCAARCAARRRPMSLATPIALPEQQPGAAASVAGGAGAGRCTLSCWLSRLLWLFPLLWAAYTSLRPYADTADSRLRLAARHADAGQLRRRLARRRAARHFQQRAVVVPSVVIVLALAPGWPSWLSASAWRWNVALLVFFIAANLLPPHVLITPLFASTWPCPCRRR
jgi:ABC-type glycerol-3-phosphate transport system permease component